MFYDDEMCATEMSRITNHMILIRSVESESESPGVRVLSRSRSRSFSFGGDSDSGPYLSHLDFCVILLQSIWLSCNLFYN